MLEHAQQYPLYNNDNIKFYKTKTQDRTSFRVNKKELRRLKIYNPSEILQHFKELTIEILEMNR